MSAKRLYEAAKAYLNLQDASRINPGTAYISNEPELRTAVANYRDPVNYGFEGWCAGQAPIDFFDDGKWLECLHAVLPALAHVDDELRDTGLIHELVHLSLGVDIGIENRFRLMRDKILEIQGTFNVKQCFFITKDQLTKEQLQDLAVRNVVTRLLRRDDSYTAIQGSADLRRIFDADPHPGIELATSTVRDAARLATVLGHVFKGVPGEWIIRHGEPNAETRTKQAFLQAVDCQLTHRGDQDANR